MPSIAGGIAKSLQLAVAEIYPDSNPPNDRFVTDDNKNLPIRRVANSPYQYISPISHQLAAKFQLAPLAICQSLLQYIPPKIEPLSPQVEIQCWYTDKGYICFQLTPRSIAIWLDYIYTWKPHEQFEPKYPPNVDLSLALALALAKPLPQPKPLPNLTVGYRQQQKPSPCEIAIYARDRCRSILKLACAEGLISQDISGDWQIPPSQWFDRDSDSGNNRPRADIIGSFESVAEDRLIHALMDVLDSICGSRPPDSARIIIDLAQSWLEFHRHCRIFGDVQRQNPHLAIARCGLTAICERYLSGVRGQGCRNCRWLCLC
jgi:hypothetical protein